MNNMGKSTKETMQKLGMGDEILPYLATIRDLQKKGLSIQKIAKIALEEKQHLVLWGFTASKPTTPTSPWKEK